LFRSFSGKRRPIWASFGFYFFKVRVIIYIDDALKAEEESDLAMRIKNLEDKEKMLSGDEEKQLTEYKTRLYVKIT